ncbi:MAG TPA: hypothetical protein VK601_31375, partial [Kofleriaceae bacterium]|nr:hypothetical protein [Kofleriaceae bacterium]
MGVVCAAWAAMAGCRSEAPSPGAQISGAVTPAAATSGGEFRYAVVDGAPVVAWFAADGAQVIVMRVDSRWVCDQSSGQLRCGARQAARASCPPDCQPNACPCSDARCLPLCHQNALPGLHDPAA